MINVIFFLLQLFIILKLETFKIRKTLPRYINFKNFVGNSIRYKKKKSISLKQCKKVIVHTVLYIQFA